ncbi:MAG: ABC transporter substrate-binding protein [Candidatus Obscuribacterales bacterium]|nr:ABC transporter substrate-binding protein [Candidatus Obscuribacterales bacterium]
MFEQGVTRREILKQAIGLSVANSALQLISNSPAFAVSNPAVLTSGYIPILDSSPLIVAYEKGFFKAQGIKAEKPTLIRTWPALMEAFGSKQILLTHILLPQVIFLRYAQKLPVRTVAFNHTDVITILKGKNLKKTTDFAGKTVGIPTWWSPHNCMLQDVLRKAGLKPLAGKNAADLAANEVALKVVAPPDMVESLKTGAISGYAISEPFGAAGEILAEGTVVKMSGDIWKHHPCCQSVLLQETINKDRQWAQAVTNAIYQAALWAHQNRQELAHILGKDGGGYFPMPTRIIERALLKEDLQTYGPAGSGAIMHADWHVQRAEFYPFPYASAFDVMLDLMKRTVVDKSVALPNELRKLSGQQVANEVVEYELAKNAYKVVNGPGSFGLDNKHPFERKEQYEVLLKPE